MKNYISLLILLIVFVVNAPAQELKHIKYGDYSVGFKSIQVTDFSRPSYQPGQYGRSLQINVWYPAKNNAASLLNFSSYVYLGSETNSINDSKARHGTLRKYLDQLASGGADTASWRTFFNKSVPMKGRLNASFLRGKYPVILLMHGAASDYAFMGEFLASHGMISVNVPYKGYLQSKFDVNVIGMETEIRDHEYALDHIIKTFVLDLKDLGLVGLSFGGQSAVGLGVRNKKVRGIVSLDGGIGSSFGPQLLAGFPFYHIEKVNMPLLHLYNPADAGGNIDWFNTCQYTDRWLVPFKNMDHSFFTSYGLLDNYINNVIGTSKPKPGNNYEAILAFTIKFFQELFFDKQSGVQEITRLANQNAWISDCIEPVVYKRKEFSPIPIEEIQLVLNEKGIEGLRILRQQYKPSTAIPISDNSYRTIFISAFSENDKDAMLAIVELYEMDFPQSALPKYFKGRALQLNAKEDEAKVYFQKCLDLLGIDKSLSVSEKEYYTSRCQSSLKG
jgi:Chlorophyllase